MNKNVTRSQEEIRDRYLAAEPFDLFGWVGEVLLPYMDHATVSPYLKTGITAEQWEEVKEGLGDVGTVAEEYYRFALTKIEDRRGISAERSVIKLREYAWLMGQDDVVTRMDEIPFTKYGAAKVAVFGEAFGLTGANQ